MDRCHSFGYDFTFAHANILYNEKIIMSLKLLPHLPAFNESKGCNLSQKHKFFEFVLLSLDVKWELMYIWCLRHWHDWYAGNLQKSILQGNPFGFITLGIKLCGPSPVVIVWYMTYICWWKVACLTFSPCCAEIIPQGVTYTFAFPSLLNNEIIAVEGNHILPYLFDTMDIDV